MIWEVVRYVVARGKWFLVPIILMAMIVGGLLALGSAFPAAAPFIYTIF